MTNSAPGRELDDEGWQTREVFANFGLAMYFAQVLEIGIVNTVMAARNSLREFASAPEYEAAWDEHFTVTMGRLLGRIEPHVGDDYGLLDALRESLAVRNRFAHEFFRVHSEHLGTSSGREQMLAECRSAQRMFQDADSRLAPVMERYMKACGVDIEDFRRAVETHVEGLRSKV